MKDLIKRKDFILICVIVASGFILYVGLCHILGYPIISSKSERIVYNQPLKTGFEGDDVPSIDLFLVDSLTRVNVRNLSIRRPIILFYFSPYCPFCQSEVSEIIKGIDELGGIDFYFITPFPFFDMRQFYRKYELSKYRNIYVGLDYKFKFGEYFKTTNIPFIVLYDGRRRLKSAFLGYVPYQQLKYEIEK